MKCEIKGRYGISCTLTKLNDGKWKMNTYNDFMRFGMTEDGDSILFVDPDGGPFIGVGDSLHVFHRNLPKKKITKITSKMDDGIIIHTAKS